MKSKNYCRSFVNRKSIALLAAVVLMVSAGVDVALAKTAQEINASVNASLDRFYKQVKGGKELAGKAKGVLVLPGVVKAGLIVGAEYGEGALRVGGKTSPTTILPLDRSGFKLAGRPRTSS